MTYDVTSRLLELTPPGPEAAPPKAVDPAMDRYLALPPGMSPDIRNLVTAIAPPSECPDDYSKAVRIRDYLSDSSRFAYTLKRTPTPGVEPVYDFLFNIRRGHCEYFASAMTVMLRCAGIRARMVNGFKVNEWNPIGQYYIVRQAHAHSWTEAYLQPGGWRTFDPSVLRDAATPEPVFARRWSLHLYDTIESFWVQQVLNFDADKQGALFARASNWIDRVHLKLRLLRWERLSIWLEILNDSVRSVARRMAEWYLLECVAVVLLALGAVILLRRRPGRGRRTRRDRVFRFYDRMETLLGRKGMFRGVGQTPWEFHDAVAAAKCPCMEPVRRITHAFYEARYGGISADSEEMDALSVSLNTLRMTMRDWRPQMEQRDPGASQSRDRS